MATTTPINTNTRLADQGLINKYRKPYLVINILIFLAIWIFVKPVYLLPNSIQELIEGVAVIIIVLGIFGRIFATLTIGGKKDKAVSKTEMYSLVRHPLYFSSLLMTIGFCLYIGRVELLAYGLFTFLSTFYPMLKNEEKYLIKLFGQEYIDYRKEVPMLFPKTLKMKNHEFLEVKTRLVFKTFFDASIVLLILPIIEFFGKF